MMSFPICIYNFKVYLIHRFHCVHKHFLYLNAYCNIYYRFFQSLLYNILCLFHYKIILFLAIYSPQKQVPKSWDLSPSPAKNFSKTFYGVLSALLGKFKLNLCLLQHPSWCYCNRCGWGYGTCPCGNIPQIDATFC